MQLRALLLEPTAGKGTANMANQERKMGKLCRIVAVLVTVLAAGLGCDSSCATDGDCGGAEFCDREGTCEEIKASVKYGTVCDESNYDGLDRDLNFCAA